MGTQKRLIALIVLVVLCGLAPLQAQDYIMDKPIKAEDLETDYSFKKNVQLFVGSSFSLINYFRSVGAFSNYSISPPPLCLMAGYRPVHWFSIDAGFNYENYKMMYHVAGTNNFEKSLVTRVNCGIRPVLYAKVDEGNYIFGGFRVGAVFGSGTRKLGQEFGFLGSGIFKESGGTFQIFLGQQYKFTRNGSLQYEFALGSPYYFALGYVHHFNLGEK